MNFVQPIRNPDDVERMKEYFKARSLRNYVMFVLGCNSALRGGDLLKLRVKDVRGKKHITVTEKKTKKHRRFLVHEEIRKLLLSYTEGMAPDAFLFPSRKGKGSRPISTHQAWHIISSAARELGLQEIALHSLRKTWGYNAYLHTKDSVVVQESFKHSSWAVTRRYVGITQDYIDDALKEMVI